MNCPSRTDDTLLHDGWNQSPRFLSPDLTTRQDLDGISNTREKKDDESGPGTLRGSSNCKVIPTLEEKDAGNHLGAGCEASLTMSGMKSKHVFFCNNLLTSEQDASLPKILISKSITMDWIQIPMFSHHIRVSRIGRCGSSPCFLSRQSSPSII